MPGIGYKVTNDIVLLSTSFSLVGLGVQGSPKRCKHSLSFILTEYSQILYLQMCLLADAWKPEIHTCRASVAICRYAHAHMLCTAKNVSCHSTLPHAVEQGRGLPSGSSAHATNKRPLHGLASATGFAFLCFSLLILQFKTAPKRRAAALAWAPKCKEAAVCPLETIRECDKLHSGVAYHAVGCEFNGNKSVISMKEIRGL